MKMIPIYTFSQNYILEADIISITSKLSGFDFRLNVCIIYIIMFLKNQNNRNSLISHFKRQKNENIIL